MKRLEIHRIDVRNGSLFSNGIGVDEIGDFINFIGHTKTMMNILEDLEDFEENPEHGRPAIYVEGWQIQ